MSFVHARSYAFLLMYFGRPRVLPTTAAASQKCKFAENTAAFKRCLTVRLSYDSHGSPRPPHPLHPSLPRRCCDEYTTTHRARPRAGDTCRRWASPDCARRRGAGRRGTARWSASAFARHSSHVLAASRAPAVNTTAIHFPRLSYCTLWLMPMIVYIRFWHIHTCTCCVLS